MKKTLRIILGLMLAGAISYARPMQAQAGTGPCDILAAAGTPCIAAHSLARRMLAAYAGSLFQVTRASDSTALNVGTLFHGHSERSSRHQFLRGDHLCHF